MEAMDEGERFELGVLSRELAFRIGELVVTDDCIEPLTVLPFPYDPAA